MSDLRFLPQTLTLYRSLCAHDDRSRMIVLCMDDESLDFLRRRKLPRVALIALAELERARPELARTRSVRSWTEYCWTVTPVFCRWALEQVADGATIAWIDSDVEFVRSPQALLAELGDGSLLLTPHLYKRAYPVAAPAFELTALYGRFNGGTVVFRRDARGLAAAGLWSEKSIEWCFDRCEPGRFGNQLHLDDFPERFEHTRVLTVPGGVLGPWNGGGFRIQTGAAGPTADGSSVIAYHYQSLRLQHVGSRLAPAAALNVFRLPSGSQPLEARVEPQYRLTAAERSVFWRPHVRRLAQSVSEVLAGEPEFARTIAPVATRAEMLRTARRHLGLEASRVYARPYRALRRRF